MSGLDRAFRKLPTGERPFLRVDFGNHNEAILVHKNALEAWRELGITPLCTATILDRNQPDHHAEVSAHIESWQRQGFTVTFW